MALYKIVDAEKLDLDLKNIADRIRTHVNGVSNYQFPDGFISSIDSISTKIHQNYVNGLIEEIPIVLDNMREYCLAGNYNLKNVEISDNCTSIPWYAFSSCFHLELEKLPDGITTIGGYAFKYCYGVTLSELPESLRVIYDNAFENCTGLTTLVIPPNTEKIWEYAFVGCSNLKSVTIKGSTIVMDRLAFYRCNNITTINVPWSEGSIEGAPWGAINATINYNYTED